MKKTIGIILTIILISVSTLVYAVTPTYDVEITPSKTELKKAEEVKVTVAIKNATGMTSGIYGCMGKLQYDTEVFEKVTQKSFEGSGSPFYNENNGRFIVETNGITSEGDIFTITLKVKETATIGTIGEIKVTDFSASEGDADIKANGDASVLIKVIEEKTNPDDDNNDTSDDSNNGDTGNNNNDNNDNTTDNDNNNDNNDDNSSDNGDNNNSNDDNDDDSTNNKDEDDNNVNNKDDEDDEEDKKENDDKENNIAGGTTNNGTNNSTNKPIKDKEDTTKSPTLIPQTGETSVIVIAIMIVVAIGVFSYIKYKRAY